MRNFSGLHPPFICPMHQEVLYDNKNGLQLDCQRGCLFPIINDIPRFVKPDNYAASFGLQWNKFRKTQLDSTCKVEISKKRLTRIARGSLNWLRGKTVLEAGCGAGRFTEILLNAGSIVTACDLSSAVDANKLNFRDHPFLRVIQADNLNLPFSEGAFDIVICVGVLQHTPNPESTIKALAANLKPDGVLLIDHYTENYPSTLSRRVLRALLLKIKATSRLALLENLVSIFWPIHRFVYFVSRGKCRSRSVVSRSISFVFTTLSPIVDHQYRFPDLPPLLQREWAILDTHDTLTDAYKHKRSLAQLTSYLQELGFKDIRGEYAGNGVEISAIR
jgi:SAM-dependent methyltransferase